MKNILKSIGDYYKHIAKSMGKLLYAFIPIFGLVTWGAVSAAVRGEGALPLGFVIFLTIVYHIAFAIDKKKKDKLKKD